MSPVPLANLLAAFRQVPDEEIDDANVAEALIGYGQARKPKGDRSGELGGQDPAIEGGLRRSRRVQ